MPRQFWDLMELESKDGFWQFEDGTNIAWSVETHADTTEAISLRACALCGAYKLKLCDALILSGECPIT